MANVAEKWFVLHLQLAFNEFKIDQYCSCEKFEFSLFCGLQKHFFEMVFHPNQMVFCKKKRWWCGLKLACIEQRRLVAKVFFFYTSDDYRQFMSSMLWPPGSSLLAYRVLKKVTKLQQDLNCSIQRLIRFQSVFKKVLNKPKIIEIEQNWHDLNQCAPCMYACFSHV